MGKEKGTASDFSKLNPADDERVAEEVPLSYADSQRLIHELKVRQFELEMQNEELMRARDERQEMEVLLGKYSDLYDFSPVGYFNLDRRGTILTVNLTGAGYLGENRSVLLNQRLDYYIPEENLPIFHAFLGRVFSSDAKQTCEVAFLKKGYPAIHTLVEAFVDESGNECKAIVVDITERKLSEETNTKLAAIVKTSDDAIITLDLNGVILDWNTGAERLYGYRAAEVIHRPISLLIPPELVGEEARILRRLLAGQKVDHFETVRVSSGGRRIDVSVTVSLLIEAGKIVGASTIARDITERKRAEEYGEMSREVLQILNGIAHPQELIRQLLSSLKARTGFHAAGIRLQDRDFPCQALQGFPMDFLLTDDTLIDCSDIGKACRDKDGNVSCACPCGQVISGTMAPSSPHFSPGGSFWTNGSAPLLDLPPSAESPINPGKHCMQLGYASVALVPIRSKDRIIGLIHLADRRKGRLTLSAVELLEGVGSHIGAALVRKQIEEQHRTILRIAMDGFWLLDTQGSLVEVNETYCQMTGFSEQELLTMSIFDLDAAVTADSNTVRLQKILAQGKGRFESLHRRKDGSFFDAEVSIQYQPVAGGRIVAFVRDITERKQTEAYKEMGRGILQILNETTDLQDSLGKVITTLKELAVFDAVAIRLQEQDDFPYFTHNGFPKSFLLTENRLVERDDSGSVCRGKDGNPSLECACGMVISGKTDPTHPLFTPGGSFWTNDSFPLLDLPPSEDPRPHPRNVCIRRGYASLALIPIRSNNRIVGLIQINDRRKGRFTLEKLELLEGIASHIGAAMLRMKAESERIKLENQLQHAQKMESVGRLAGGVAHDFNNMLSVIIGHANLALMDLDSGHPVQINMEEIRKAAERSADLTRQLLAFARKQTVAPKAVVLNEAVAGLLVMLKRLIGEHINLKWQPETDLWPVKVDPSQIDQILANLCVNARDAIDDVGEINIETKNITIDEDYCAYHVAIVPGEYVCLAVSDDGHGMDKETLRHIFEPFFTTKGVGEGTGLGLSTVYGATRQNNGFINVYSEPGLGTTFTLYLPRYVGHVQIQAESVVEPVSGGQETILLVEDEPSILSMATTILTRMGYIVLATDTPGEAIQLARKHGGEISLLLTDVIMPEMNGRELADKLLTQYPGLRRLFMSGYTSDVIAHHGVLDEGVHFIQKPFTLVALAAKVREVLDI
jgi:PAS domain S-box-containing protein